MVRKAGNADDQCLDGLDFSGYQYYADNIGSSPSEFLQGFRELTHSHTVTPFEAPGKQAF